MRCFIVLCAAGAAAAGLLIGCSSERAASPPGWSACYVGTDARAVCYSQELKLPDDKLYALDDCRSGNGVLKDACPSTHLVGACASSGKVRTSKGFDTRALRRHEYLHPDVRKPELLAQMRERCEKGQGTWEEPADRKGS